MTELWLVRHGQTDWNLAGRYQGHADIPLNAAGRQQAQQLAKLLENQPFAAIYSSDLLRARQTADLIAAGHSLGVQTDVRLREIDQGEWEGLRYSDIVEQYASLAEQYKHRPDEWRAPQGESVSQVAKRVQAAVTNICTFYPDESVLVVAHGLCLATLICTAQNIPLAEVYNHIPDNASPVMLTWRR